LSFNEMIVAYADPEEVELQKIYTTQEIVDFVKANIHHNGRVVIKSLITDKRHNIGWNIYSFKDQRPTHYSVSFLDSIAYVELNDRWEIVTIFEDETC